MKPEFPNFFEEFIYCFFSRSYSIKTYSRNSYRQYIVTCISWYSTVVILLDEGANRALLLCDFNPAISIPGAPEKAERQIFSTMRSKSVIVLLHH